MKNSLWIFVVAIVFAAFLGQPAQAANDTWTGTTNTNWSGTATNWSGGQPGAGDVAQFSTTFTNQPTVNGTTTVGGIWATTGLGQNVTIGAGAILDLTGTQTINGNANTAILLDDTANHNLTISAPLTTLNSTSFLVNSSGTLTIQTGALNIAAGSTLTFGGTGASGNIIVSSATANTTGAMAVNTSGTVTFTAANLNTGGFTLTNGKVIITNQTGLGAAASAVNLNGGTLDVQLNTASTGFNPITVAGTTTILTDRTSSGAGVANTFGTLNLSGTNTLTVSDGPNDTSAGRIQFGATTISGGGGATINATNNVILIFGLSSAGFAGAGNITFESTDGTAGTSIRGTSAGTRSSGVTTLASGTLTLNSAAAVGVTSTLLGTTATTLQLNGGTFGMQMDNSVGAYNTTIGGTVTIGVDNNTSTGGVTDTLGTLSIGTTTLTVGGGKFLTFTATSVSTSGTDALVFGATTLTGDTTFNVTNTANSGTSVTTLTLGSLNDGGTSFTMTKTGTATMILNGASGAGLTATSDQINVTAGTLTSNAANALGGNTSPINVDVSSGAFLNLTASGSVGDLSDTGSVTLGANTLSIGSTANLTGTFGGVISGATGGINKAVGGTETLTGTNVYGGTTTVSGGTLILTGTNTTAGTTSLTGGVLQLNNVNNGGLATGAVTLNGGSLQSLPGAQALANNFTLTTSGTISGSNGITLNGTLTGSGATNTLNNNLSSGTLTLAGTVNIDAISGTAQTLVIGGSANTTISGTITDFSGGTGTSHGALSITNTGTTTLTSPSNTYAGGTSVSAGTLKIGTATSILSGSALTTASPGIVDINGNTITFGTVTNNGTILNNAGGTPTLTIGNGSTGAGNFSGPMNIIWNQGATAGSMTGTFTNTGNITLNATNAAGTIGLLGGFVNNTGTITNSGAAGATTISSNIGSNVTGVVENSATSTLTLSGTNTYAGPTILTNGTVNINSATALGTGTFTITAGTINNTSGSAVTLTNNNAQNWNGGFTFTGANALNLGTGPVVLGATVALNDNASILTVGGNISGSGFGITKTGTGTLILNGNNSYTGLTTFSAGTLTLAGTNTTTGGLTMSGGTLNINNNSALGTAGTVTITGGVIDNTSGSAEVLTGNNPISTTGFTFTGSNALNLGSGAITLTNNTTVTTVSGTNTLEMDGVLSGAFKFTKAGTGTLVLSGGGTNGAAGNNSALGVTGGTLDIMGAYNAVASSGVSTVGAGSVLDFSGAAGTYGSSTNIGITVGGVGSELLLDDRNGTANAHRVGTGTSVTLNNRGTLLYEGTDDQSGLQGDYNETFGSITLGNGTSTITIAANSNANSVNARLVANNAFTRASSTGGIALVNGVGLGSAGADNQIPQLILSTNPTLVGTIAGTTAINTGVDNTKIVPFLLGEATQASGGLGTQTGTANTFLTYEGGGSSGTGLRPLNPTDEFMNNAIVAGDNTYITSNTTATGTGTVLINSLVVNGGNLSINDGLTLTDTSGAILFVTSNAVQPSGTTGVLDFGASEAIISANAGVNATISANVTGSGGLTVYGPGIVVLSGSNSFSGTSTASGGGTLAIGSNGALGNSTYSTTGGGVLEAAYQARTVSNFLSGGASGVVGGSNDLTFNRSGAGTPAAAGFLEVTNTGTTTISGTFSLDNSATVGAHATGQVQLGSNTNLVLSGGISDNNLGNVSSGSGSLFNPLFTGTNGNITINGSNSFGLGGGNMQVGTTGNSAPGYYNTITITGTGTITPFGNLTWTTGSPGGGNGAGSAYLVAGNSGLTLTNNISAGESNLTGAQFGFAGSNSLTISGTLTTGGGFSSNTIINLATNDPATNNPANNTTVLTFSGSVIGSASASATYGGTGNYDFSSTSVLSGVNGFNKSGRGTLTISGTNIMSGATSNNFNGGTVVLDYSTNDNNKLSLDGTASAAALTLGAVNLQLSGGSNSVYAQTLGVGNGTTISGGQTNISDTNGGNTTINLGALTHTAGGGGSVINFQSGVAITSTANTASGIIGGWATVNGTDWAVANGASAITAYASYTALPLGSTATTSTVNYSLAGNGASSTSVANSINTLKLTTTGAGTLTLGGAMTINNGGLLFTGANNYTIAGSTVQSGSGVDLSVQQYGTGTLTIASNIIAGGGTSGLVLGGTGTLVLTGANTYGNGTFVTGGTLQVSSDSNLGAAGQIVSIFNGATFDMTASGTTSRALSFGSGTIQVDTGTYEVDGKVSGGFYKTGAGTLYLTNSTNAPAEINILGGTIKVGNQTALGPVSNAPIANGNSVNRASAPLFVNGGTLDIFGQTLLMGNVTMTSGTITDSAGGGSLAAFSFTLDGGTVSANLTDLIIAASIDNDTSVTKGSDGTTAGGTLILTGANTYTGATLVQAGTLQVGNGGATGQVGPANVTLSGTSALSFDRNNTYAVANAISGTGSVSQIGSGTTVLSGVNSYSGGTTITNGTLQLATGGTVGASTGSMSVSTGAFDLNGVNATVGALTLGGTGTIAATSSGTLTTSGVTVSGLNNAINANATVVGAVTFSGVSSLAVNGTAVGAVTVSSGATLAGVGTISGSLTTLSGGHIAPGATAALGTVGTLNVGNLGFTINSGTNLDFDLAATSGGTSDQIAMSGGVLTFGGGTVTLNANELGTSLSGTYVLISGAGSVAGFGSTTFLATGTGTLTYNFINTGTALDVSFTAPAAATTGTYTLTASAGSTVLHAGGSTSIVSTITNTGTTTADTINYTGLGVTGGTVSGAATNGGPLAQTASGTNTQTFATTAGQSGSTTFTPVVTSALNATAGGTATLASTGTTTVTVYTGAGVWATAGSGSWGTPSATQTAWQANGGVPGLDPGFTNTDSAAFGTVSGTNSATVSLNGQSPSLNTISFATTGGGFTIAQGTGSGSLTLSNTGTISAAITDTSVTSNNTISAPITLASNLNATVTNASGTVTLSGNIGGAGKSITKNGLGVLVMSGSNTYSGGTTLSLGTLVAASSTTVSGGNLVSGPFGTGLLTLVGGTTLDDNGTPITLANAVSASGTITFASTGSGSLTFSGAGLTTSGSFTLTNNTDLYVNNTTTIADNISNASGFTLTKYGNGTLNLTGTGSNNGTASTTVSNGTISVASGSSLGSGTVTLFNGTGLSYNGTTSGTLNQNITVTGTGSVGTISNASGQVLTLTGTLNKNGSTLDISGGRNVISGMIVGSSPHSDVNYIGNSTTGLTNTSTYNGPTSISGTSTLLTGVNNALPTSTYTDLTLGASSDVASTVNTLDLLGTSQTVASLTSTGTGTNQVISSNGSATTPAIGTGASTGSPGNLTVNVASGTNTYTGLLGDSNLTRNANNFGLTKSGTGTLALTNANTYSGGTTINAGTLIVSNLSGSATGSGFLNLSNGATLTGTGTINASGNSTIDGKVVVGNGVDATSTMTMTTTGTTNFMSDSNLTFNLNKAGSSNAINLGSSATAFSSGATLSLTLLNSDTTDFLSGTNYSLLIGTSTSQYSGLVFGGAVSGGTLITNLNLVLLGTATNGQLNSTYYNRSFLFLTSGGNIDVEVVPEPGTWALMLGGLALLVLFQRARRKNN